MQEQITNMKNYVKENKESIIGMATIATISYVSWKLGRFSAREDIEVKASYLDDQGNIVKEIYQRRVK